MKIFRDLIYVVKGLMREDHRYYKKHGLYDFPHRERSKIWKMRFAGLALKMPKTRVRASKLMRDALVKQYESIIGDPPSAKRKQALEHRGSLELDISQEELETQRKNP